MRIKLIILTFLFIFLGARSASAAISFTISNPQQSGNEVTIDVSLSGLTSSSCLNGSCYLQAAFTSPTPIRYFGFTKNNSGQWYEYISSPIQSYIQSTFFTFQPVSGTWSGQLTLKINTEDSNYHGPGTYNIKAWRYSGNSSTASGDSNILAVNIQGSISTPTPTPSFTSAPSSIQQPNSSFTISNIPSQINSDQSFKVSVNLTLPNNKNTEYFLSGAFKKTGGTRYFGLTKISSNWVKYESSNYLNQYKITTDESGNWTGILEVKPDTADSDYKGSGDYIFKVSRYTANGSQTWSNESTIKIISTESDQDATSINTSSLKSTTSISPSFVKTTTTSNKSSKSKNYDTLVYHNASVAAATTSAGYTAPSAEVEVKNQKQTNPIIWIGLIFIFAGASTLGYIYLKKNARIHFPLRK